MNALSTWLKRAQLLLAPTFSQCLICGKGRRPSPELPGICQSCASVIPWIRCPRCAKCGRPVGCPDCTRSGEPSPIVCNRSAVSYNGIMREILGRYKYRGDERFTPLLGIMLDRAYSLLKEEQEQADGRYGAKTRPQPGARAQPVQTALPQRDIAPRRLSVSMLLQSKPSAHSGVWRADLLVPVPVSDTRLEERGFNQAERLADVLSRRRGIPQLPLLIRTHHTGKQSFKGRAERMTAMKHAFAANPDPLIRALLADWLESLQPLTRPLQILIIDDIYTTGSTIRACAEAVRGITADLGCTAQIYSLTWARS